MDWRIGKDIVDWFHKPFYNSRVVYDEIEEWIDNFAKLNIEKVRDNFKEKLFALVSEMQGEQKEQWKAKILELEGKVFENKSKRY